MFSVLLLKYLFRHLRYTNRHLKLLFSHATTKDRVRRAKTKNITGMVIKEQHRRNRMKETITLRLIVTTTLNQITVTHAFYVNELL